MVFLSQCSGTIGASAALFVLLHRLTISCTMFYPPLVLQPDPSLCPPRQRMDDTSTVELVYTLSMLSDVRILFVYRFGSFVRRLLLISEAINKENLE